MKLITLDFETYYDQDYSLSKLTTEAYIRDPRFEAILVGVKVDDQPAQTFVGADIGPALEALDLENNAVLCHHAHFDCYILNHHYGIRPKIIFDTLAMARAEVGSVVTRSYTLGSLAKHFGLVDKGEEVIMAKGKHLADFTANELGGYRTYCELDCILERQLFDIMRPAFSLDELRLIDLTTRLFTEPILDLDVNLLAEYKQNVVAHKAYLMLRAGVTREMLTSSEKFAGLLRTAGVEPGMKDSPTAKLPDGSPKRTYAFAKTDDFMKALAESDDEYLAALAEARLGVKTSIAETRAQRLIDCGQRGAAPVYLRYWGAEQTGRHGGGDKTNWQNFGRGKALEDFNLVQGAVVITPKGRATVAKVSKDGSRLLSTAGEFKVKQCHQIGLRDAVRAPEGYRLVVGDSSNIEARVICLLAGQEDVLQQFREGIDPYCALASSIFNRPITKADFMERQLGKVGRLGLGFGMGKDKFFDTARKPPWNCDVPRELTDHAHLVFRGTNDKLVGYWKYLNDEVIPAMYSGKRIYADRLGLMHTEKGMIRLPSGRALRYPNLGQEEREEGWGTQWSFETREGARILLKKIYGGMCAENTTQAIARIVVLEQAVKIAKRYRVVHLVHDEVVCCVPEEQVEACEKYVLEVMSTAPTWAPTLPVAAETGTGVIYGCTK